jgi:ATP-dependent helicase/nuclease subunit A
MTKSIAERVIETFRLTPAQKEAALERGRDVAVTAGAGSGKTRTLVARYASLLADGLLPRRVVAITFTEKAAREMRSRVRDALQMLASRAESAPEKEQWLSLGSQLDSARIGTIHSLCAEILRAHPAEAGVDPRFEVLDEGLSAALRAEVVVETLSMLVGLSQFTQLFQVFETRGVKTLLETLLGRRLEAQETFNQNMDGKHVICQILSERMKSPSLVQPITELRYIPISSLMKNEGDKFGEMVKALLLLWDQAEAALEKGDVIACAENLFQARRTKMSGTVGKKGSALKDTVAAIKEAFDELLDPLSGGSDSKDTPPNQESEALFAELQPLVRSAFEFLHNAYRERLRQRQALDFDDLEYGAMQLLKRADIRTHWQAELDSLLVDEFQDTNARQREIVQGLSGVSGRLFVVGDARQSIYRFRRADVTVFRAIQKKVSDEGGLVKNLDITYRAHDSLLSATGDLLADIMGTDADPARPYFVPFSPLNADRQLAPDHVKEPHVEIVLGAGEDTASARPVAARALATRLLELKEAGQIRTWDDVALLFRASTGYIHYEDAFEEMGIPFVTVSGRGFYNRPEIRDVLNLLRALADPADDLAMAGLLRSPAFGLTDAALFQLRWQTQTPLAYWVALQGDLSLLGDTDHAQAVRALQILSALLPLVDRVPVAELLKHLVDLTDYRSILAADDSSGSARLWRNLDKLIGDAQSSGQVNVRDFLQYLATLSDAGAREGEAPVEAQGAVRLMTIHKSKGLEFPLVVLADAGREPRGGSDNVYLLPEYGLSFKLENPPLLYRLSRWLDKQQNEAETQRLLYVALTRAKDKLLISGHAAPTRSGSAMTVSAWMADLCEAAGVDVQVAIGQSGTPISTRTKSGHGVRTLCISKNAGETPNMEQAARTTLEEPNLVSLYLPLAVPVPASVSEDEPELSHPWRVTGSGQPVPAGVIGQMVHKAIELWLFPEDPRLIPMLEAAALQAGLASESQRIEAVRRVRELLERFRLHPIWDEIDSADERHHELPYSRMAEGRAETGYIDLLYRNTDGWKIIDFKTDIIRNEAVRTKLAGLYKIQMLRYEKAIETLVGQAPQVCICFLDDHGSLNIHPIT